MSWILRMAWRDGRAALGPLLIFLFSISLGIAALVAANSLQANIRRAIDQNAKTLLGADLVISSREAIPAEITDILKQANLAMTQETMFNSMAYFPKSESSRLVVIRALTGDFPYYGDMVTDPPDAARRFRMEDHALLEEALFYQFDLSVGDKVRIGQKEFQIGGKLIKNAGEVMGSFFSAPRIFIGQQYVGETELIQTGSLRRYKIYIQEPSAPKLKAIQTELEEMAKTVPIRLESVQDRKENVGSGAQNLNRFLNLAGFIVLLLGGIGVASSIQVYVQKKKTTMAILKCLGATGRQGLFIFTVQAIILGILGAGMGAILGVLLQKAMCVSLASVLPIPLPFELSWHSIVSGLVMGLGAAFLFALMPLIPIKHVSPLEALRSAGTDRNASPIYRSQQLSLVLIVLFTFVFSVYYLRSWLWSAVFVAVLLGVLAFFWGTAHGLTFVLKKVISRRWPYSFRQGLSNLYRPNNQTTLLLTSLGFGTFLILTMALTHQALLKKITVSTSDGRPNMGLFDIATRTLPKVEDLLQVQEMPIIQSVPIVSMRIASINGSTIAELKKRDDIPRWTLHRQYRSTYRDELNNNEWVVKGRWHGDADVPKSPTPVSVEEGIAEDLQVSVGDSIVFDVAGRPMPTIVSTIRKVDWYQIQPTFFVVFPKGVLENAPQFHVLTTHAPTSAASARLQKAAAQQFPEISVIDLRIILSAVDQYIRQVSTALRFVAGLIILVGFTMLIGTLSTSRFQRQQQTALLRTMGASRAQISIINLIEYGGLGLLAVLTGLLPALLGSWTLTEYFFKSQFTVHMPSALGIGGSVIGATIVVCFLNFRPILRQSPMTVLREEVF